MYYLNLLWIIPLSILIGIVINHFADTLPVYRKILVSPICSKCEQKIKWTDYLRLRRCSHCQHKPIRRFVLQIIIIITYVLVFLFPPDYSRIIPTLIIFSYLALIFIIDLEYRLILHPVSLIGGLLFFGLGICLNGFINTLIGGGAGFIFMYALYLFGILFSKWIAKRRGEELDEVALGYGDVILTTILGLLLGWPRIVVLLFFAILLGGIFSSVYMVILKIRKKYELFTPIPYAPFLIISTVILIYISSAN